MPLDIPSLFAGAGAGVLGAVVGAWATVRLGFVFQRKLQEEQQKFQQKLLDEQLAFQEQLLKHQLEFENALAMQNGEEEK
jgi:membrane protein DedA with SNARE-associated domain